VKITLTYTLISLQSAAWKKRENQLFGNAFKKTVTFTKFLLEIWEFSKNDCTLYIEIMEIYSHWKNISSKHLSSNSFSKTVTFTKFLAQIRECEFNFRNFHCVDCHSTQSVLYSHCFSQIFRGINVILLSQYSSTNSVVQNAWWESNWIHLFWT